MKTYTEKNMKAAYIAGWSSADNYYNSGGELALNYEEWLESYNTPPEPEEEELPFHFWFIEKKCGWSKWCDITGGNHYMINEFGRPDDTETFYCTESQARKLGLI